MAKKKAEILTENQISHTYEVIKGFNVPKGRFDVGKDKPNFVFEKDFAPDEWKALTEMGAVKRVETTEVREDEVVIFEKVEK